MFIYHKTINNPLAKNETPGKISEFDPKKTHYNESSWKNLRF